MGTVILLSGLGIIGAWVGWTLGIRLAYGHSHDLSQSPHLRVWGLVPAVILAFVGVVFGYALLILLEA